tara:strand:- start:1740 stop:3011 length:1272 start_codon:yes stop_codon:yes gene_type:complete
MSAVRLSFAPASAEELSSMPNLINPNALKLLECCVCQETIENPRRACENDHYNCLKCLEKIEETSRRSDQSCACPTCREPLIVGKAADGKAGRPVPAICEVIESQLCACPHGCGMVGPISKLREHTADRCPKAPIKCPYWGVGCCFELIPRDEMDQHLKDHQSDHQMLMNNEQKRMREEVSWVGKSAKHDRKKIVESVTSYKAETNMIINTLTGTVRRLSEQNVALMDGFSGLCTMVAQQNELLEAIGKGNASSSMRAAHSKAKDKGKDMIKGFERKRKAQKETPSPRPTKSRTSPPSAPGAPGPSFQLRRVVDADEEAAGEVPVHLGRPVPPDPDSEMRPWRHRVQQERPVAYGDAVQALAMSDEEEENDNTFPAAWVYLPATPGRHSPTSPGYSPTSPSYSPTSPVYEEFMADDMEDGELA